MKSLKSRDIRAVRASRPARGAWVEMILGLIWKAKAKCRAPHGARGLKFMEDPWVMAALDVAPRTGRVG